MSRGFEITNALLNQGYIVPDVLPSQVQHTIEEKLLPIPTEEDLGEIFIVCFGRGNDDWILANRNEVGKYLSDSCTNFIYPLSLVRRRIVGSQA